MSDFPVFIDEVAFASNPFDTPQIYTTLTPRTKTRTWGRGRRTEDDLPDTGTSTLVFENLDRALDSENVASIYYPNVLPMRRTRSRATLDGITYYPLFSTFVNPQQGWQLNNEETGYSEAIAAANDGFDILATAQFLAADFFPQQTPGARITAILDRFLWPAAERAIDNTSSEQEIQAAAVGSLTGQSALDQIQASSRTEDGLFFIDGRGYAIFHDRYHKLLNTRSTVSQATFCDKANYGAGRFLYKSLAPSMSPIVNDYLVTRAGGLQVEATDPTSVGKYGPRSKSLSTLHLTDADAQDFGNYKRTATKDPRRRYDEMVLEPATDRDMWLKILNFELGDRVTVMQSPVGGGAADVRDMYIEALNATIGPGVTAEVRLRLSPAAAVLGWVLGDAQYGLLGTSTYLVY